ncbi:hypothetical protein [Romboutsia sp. 1001285H_161024_C4]|uniref:hypothetical protein n=1 Tax=Romboutsia sp. 1001285H_161024_C4 TaxID=2787109 RepID=UPI001899CF5B|nr:hypothetical protein [Romboutsia sp. 1001285H_161024_C4]
MYWRIPNVRQITLKHIFTKVNKDKCMLEFIEYVEGKRYHELDSMATDFFGKTGNKIYFRRHIGTYLKYAGLLEFDCSLHEEGQIVKNELLSKLYKSESKELQSEYMNYLLLNWQFPQPQIEFSRDDEIRKPYLIILKILQMLYKKDASEAYLENKEFYDLFVISSPKSTRYIDDKYIDNIIKNRKNKSWFRYKDNKYYKKDVGYYKGFIAESFIITTDKKDYPLSQDFMIGLSKKKNWILIIDKLIDVYEGQFFEFNPNIPSDNRVVTTKFSRYISDESRFKEWRSLYKDFIVSK